MNKVLVIVPLLLLAGCATPVPVGVKFPPAPEYLLTNCEDLDKVKPDEQQLSEMMKVVTANYSKYHECRLKVESWIEWYKKQKEITDSVTK